MENTIRNLGYRMKIFFQGESGIVERVEPTSLTDNSGQIINYYRDYYGHLPEQVTFRNPLGEEVTSLTPKILKNVEFFLGLNQAHAFPVYKSYIPGDKFP